MGRQVGEFTPSIHGFRFSNYFPPGPVLRLALPFGALPVGNASNGLCGGMVFAARDYFDVGRLPPPDEEPPPPGSPLFRYIVRRLFDSFRLPSGPLKYYAWMSMPDRDTWYARGLLRRTFREEWPRLRAEIDRGRLAPFGFIRHRSANPFRLGENHQVLAYGYAREGGEVSLRLYDPNHALRDDLTMTFDPSAPLDAAPITYSTGESVRGFFATTYSPPTWVLP